MHFVIMHFSYVFLNDIIVVSLKSMYIVLLSKESPFTRSIPADTCRGEKDEARDSLVHFRMT